MCCLQDFLRKIKSVMVDNLNFLFFVPCFDKKENQEQFLPRSFEILRHFCYDMHIKHDVLTLSFSEYVYTGNLSNIQCFYIMDANGKITYALKFLATSS